MKSSPARVVGVTAALLACGAVFGALAAVVAAAMACSLTVGPRWGEVSNEMVGVAMTGAVLGGVLLPAACWLLMRRVPLVLAFAGTMLGTVAGGVLGWVLWDYSVSRLLGTDEGGISLLDGPIEGATAGAVLGFFLATVALRLRFRAPRAHADSPLPRPADA